MRDPDDERILEFAEQCGATIVTYNKRDSDGSSVPYRSKDTIGDTKDSGEQHMSVSINIPEELYDQARTIAEAQHIPLEQVFASAFADRFAAWQRQRQRGQW